MPTLKRTTIEYADGEREVLRDEWSPFGYNKEKTYSVQVDPHTGQALISKHQIYDESLFNLGTSRGIPLFGDVRTESETRTSYKPVKSIKVEETNTGCIITTACAEMLGLPDNCDELQTLRDFRDNYLMNTLNGRIAVDLYYKIAGDILAMIEDDPAREKMLKSVFRKHIRPAVRLIKKGKNKEAAQLYIKAITYLIEKCSKKINA